MKENTPKSDRATRPKRKRVSWASDIKVSDKKVAANARPRKKVKRPLRQNYDRLWRRICKCLAADDWERPVTMLLETSQVSDSVLVEFFQAKGNDIFNRALLGRSHNCLKFIFEKIPRHCAQSILQHDNYELIKQFFGRETTIDRLGMYFM